MEKRFETFRLTRAISKYILDVYGYDWELEEVSLDKNKVVISLPERKDANV